MCATTERAELLLPVSPASVRAAREFLRRANCPEHAGALLENALLLISELVTNAFAYGSPPVQVSIDCVEAGLMVRVRDGAPALPQPRQSADDDESGRGLVLLGELSHAWGTEAVDDEHGTGKAVWFELREAADREAAATPCR